MALARRKRRKKKNPDELKAAVAASVLLGSAFGIYEGGSRHSAVEGIGAGAFGGVVTFFVITGTQLFM